MKIRLYVILLWLVNFIFISISAGQSGSALFTGDFQVNDNAGECNQTTPAVALDDNGNYVVVWSDYRNGDADIFGKRYYSDGTAAGEQFRVNDDAGSGTQSNPAIAMTHDGYFGVVWEDLRNGKSEIFGQFYNFEGTSRGSNFKITNDSGNQNEYAPAIATDGNQSFLVIWIKEEYNRRGQIWGQHYLIDGMSSGSMFEIQKMTIKEDRASPALAMAENGDFLITWAEIPFDHSTIMGQCFNKDSTPKSDIFQISQGTSASYSPRIALNSRGNFMIIWSTWYMNYCVAINGRIRFENGSTSDIFQVYSTNWSNSSLATLGVGHENNFIIAWEQQYGPIYRPPDISVQCYDDTGSPLTRIFRASDDSLKDAPKYPAIAVNRKGNYVVVWQDYRNGAGNSDIYAQRFIADNTRQGQNYIINNDVGSGSGSAPKIAADDSGNFMVVWEFFQNGNYECFGQIFDYTGNRLGGNFKLNTDSVIYREVTPEISVDNSGNYLAVWCGNNGKNNIYGQFFHRDGTPAGPGFMVSEEKNGHSQCLPAVSTGKSNYFIVVWLVDQKNIYGQCYNDSGIEVGENFKVTDNVNRKCAHPAVAADKDNFLVVWEDNRNQIGTNENWDIYAQQFTKDGTLRGINFKVNGIAGGSQNFPVVSTLHDSQFVVIWSDQYRNNDFYGHILSADGKSREVFSPVNDWSGTCKDAPAIASDKTGSFVVTWQDERNGNADIYGQRYDLHGNKIGVNYRVNTDKTQKYQGTPAVAMRNGYVYYAWVDNRIPGQGYDIFARVDEFNTASAPPEQPPAGMVKAFQLEQNYPNPFNPVTRISYQLQKSGLVELQLFNVTGQRVQTLVSGFQNAGKHEVILNGEKLGSGVYCYQLRVNGASESRKCLLLR